MELGLRYRLLCTDIFVNATTYVLALHSLLSETLSENSAITSGVEPVFLMYK
jgi:hypothetical protein